MELQVVKRYREEREELESLNADIPSLADTKPSRIRIKHVEPEKCLMYRELSTLPRTRKKKPKPMFVEVGKKPRIKAKKAATTMASRYGPRKKKRS